MQKNEAFIRSFRINTSFWCGRQELKTHDIYRKPLFTRLFYVERQRGRQKFFKIPIACWDELINYI